MKIALLTDASPADFLMAQCVLGWIESMVQNGHSVRVYTTFQQSDSSLTFPDKVEVVRPFIKWSLFELIKTTPVLIQQGADALLLVPTRAAQQRPWHPSSWPWIFAQAFARAIQPNPKLGILQVQGSAPQQSLQVWLETLTDIDIKMPPIFRTQKESDPGEASRRVILIPGYLDKIVEIERFATLIAEAMTQVENLEFNFCGDWGDLKIPERRAFAKTLETYDCESRWSLTGWTRDARFEWYQSAVRKASAVWLVHSDIPARERILIAHHALHLGTPVFLSTQDRELFQQDVGLVFVDSTNFLNTLTALTRENIETTARMNLSNATTGPDQHGNLLNRNLFRLVSLRD